VQEFFEQEAQLALQDRIQRETADSKNALESYVYSLRSKLSDQLSAYAPPATRDALIERLNDMEVRGPARFDMARHGCSSCCILAQSASLFQRSVWCPPWTDCSRALQLVPAAKHVQSGLCCVKLNGAPAVIFNAT